MKRTSRTRGDDLLRQVCPHQCRQASRMRATAALGEGCVRAYALRSGSGARFTDCAIFVNLPEGEDKFAKMRYYTPRGIR